MWQLGKRKGFNLAVILVIAIMGSVLIYIAWGTLKALATDADEVPPTRARVRGEVSGTAPMPDGGNGSTTLEQAARTPAAGPSPQTSVLTLPNGTRVRGTQAEEELQQYLASDAAAGRRFPFNAPFFVQRDDVSEEPNGAITTLAAILNAYPDARVRVEVIEWNPQMNEPRYRAVDRAEALARVIVAAGVDAKRITHAGVKSRAVNAPTIELVIVAK